MAENATAYPASLSVDYPDRELNRLASFFRIIMVIPIYVVLGLVGGAVVGRRNLAGDPFRRRHSVLAHAAHDRLPAEVSQMVV